MVISAAARVAAKILAKQKYAKTAREWRKKNPDKIKAQKKRYYAAHKEQLIKEQKQWRKDNPEKARKLVQAAKERQPKPVHTKKQLHFIEWNKRIEARKIAPKPTTGVYAVWTREQKSQSGFSAFLKGFGKSKPKRVRPKRKVMPKIPIWLYSKELESLYGDQLPPPGTFETIVGLPQPLLKVPKKKLGRKPRWYDGSLLGFGGVFGGLAAYTNWNRGKKRG